MTDKQTKVVRDTLGREVLQFTTPSGVQGIVATCIPPEALVKLARKLEGKLATRQARPASAPADHDTAASSK